MERAHPGPEPGSLVVGWGVDQRTVSAGGTAHHRGGVPPAALTGCLVGRELLADRLGK